MNKFMAVIFNRRMLISLLHGFASGLPLLLVGATLKAWLKESNIDLTLIGFFSLVGLPYTLKFLWSPLMDRFVPPFLGRRRGWLLISQTGLVLGLSAMAFVDPNASMTIVAVLALSIAFLSATQDIVIDAYRTELLPKEELGMGISMYVMGYRFAIMFAGALALALSAWASWEVAYLTMAGAMALGIVVTFLSPEPLAEHVAPKSIKEAAIEPLREFFMRPEALWILGFVLLYKVGDAMASDMLMPFYLDIGFDKLSIAGIVKMSGIWAVIVGGFIGGGLMLKLGVRRSLWVFGILQAVSTFGFALLAKIGPNLWALAGVVTFENLTSGMGTAVYLAFMAMQTNRRFTATQYALLSSLMGVPRVILASPTGWMAKNMGWEAFFIFCTLIAIPGLLILLKVGKWSTAEKEVEPQAEMPVKAVNASN